MITALGDKDSDVRNHAGRALGAIVGAAGAKFSEDEIKRVGVALGVAANDSNVYVSRAAKEALLAIKEARK